MAILIFPPAASGWLPAEESDIKPPDAPKRHPEKWDRVYAPVGGAVPTNSPLILQQLPTLSTTKIGLIKRQYAGNYDARP